MSQNDTAYIPGKFLYNGKEYPFDFRDADDAEKYEKAFTYLQSEQAKSPKSGKASDILRWNCGVIRSFFDMLFGEGAGVEICGGKDNLGLHNQAFVAFMVLAKAQSEEIQNDKNTISQITGNRQQRRDQQYHGKKKKQGYHNRPQEQRPHNGPTPVK